MRYRPQRNWGARVSDYQYKGMKVGFLENELLRVGVLADKGTDVFEFNYKPKDMDFVWLAAGGVRNPVSRKVESPETRKILLTTRYCRVSLSRTTGKVP